MQNVTGNVMTMKHFVDFYYLEALRANIAMAKYANKDFQFRRAVEKLESDVETAFNSLTQTMALRIYVYLWGAALGEAQYAHENCEYKIEEIDEGNFAYRHAFNFCPSEHNVNMVKDVFGQNWSSGGYGGDAWYQIVEGMELYGKITDAAFIDHTVDLEHNGGCVFNKTGASPFNMNCYTNDFDGSDLHYFLDVKFHNDILNDTNHRRYEVSRKVYSLVVRYSNIIENIKAVDFLVPSLEWLSPFTVEWNDFEAEFTWVEAEGRRMSCEKCGCTMSEYEENYVNDMSVCNDCVTTCENCHETVLNDDSQYVDGEHETWCDDCASNHMATCDGCNKEYHTDHTVHTEDGYDFCENCAETCEECGEIHYNMKEHMAEEHETEEGETHPLPFDSDGVFQIVETWDWMDGYTLQIENVSISNHEKSVRMFVRRIPGTALRIINIGTYKHLNGEKVTKEELDKYVVLTPCGLWFTKSSDPSLETVVGIAKKSAEIIDWSQITTTDEWMKVSDAKQQAIRALI
jgi:tetratricopeptide (TPR) repeat protein